jgi:hypothetical protein
LQQSLKLPVVLLDSNSFLKNSKRSEKSYLDMLLTKQSIDYLEKIVSFRCIQFRSHDQADV